MSRGFSPIILLIAVFLLATIAGGAYYFSKTFQSRPTPIPTNITQPSPDARPAPNGAGEIANWKTYTNEEYGYSVKYPPGYRPANGPGATPSNGKEFSMLIYVVEEEGPYYPIFYVNVIPQDTGLLPDTYNNDSFTTNFNKYLNNPIGETIKLDDTPDEKFARQPNKIVDKNVATVFYGSFATLNNFDKRIFIKRGKYYYMLGGYQAEQDQSKYFDQILSTFRFD